MKFKVGDRVECIENLSRFENKILTIEKIAKLDGAEDELLYFRNEVGGWYKKRFKLLKESQPTETQQHTYNEEYHQYINNVVTPQEGEMKMNKIVELYESRRMSEINKNESMEIEKIKETESPLRKKIMKLKEDTEKELNKLYMSQFTKEQIKEFETVGVLDTTGIEVIKRGTVTLGVDIDNGYKKEEIEKIEKQADVLRDELHTLIAEVNAMLSIIPENETDKIMSVLGKYGIVTELGTLTI